MGVVEMGQSRKLGATARIIYLNKDNRSITLNSIMQKARFRELFWHFSFKGQN